MDRLDVYNVIDSERNFQDRFIQDKNLNPNKTVGEYLTLIRTYANKADAAWTGQVGDNGALEEIRKIAAICVSCMEKHGANGRSYAPVNRTSHRVIQVAPTNWLKVVSSNINAVRYDSVSRNLEIRFNDGHVYSFSNVPGNTYIGMISAASKGKYFHKNIQGKFLSTRIS